MRRWILQQWRTAAFALCFINLTLPLEGLSAQTVESMAPTLRTIAVPAAQTRSVATKLSLIYRDIPGVQISPDAKNNQLIVMAPEATQLRIAQDISSLIRAEDVQQVAATGPVSVQLTHVSWREFEDDLRQLAGSQVPVTTTKNGERASFSLNAIPLQGTTIEVDRRNNFVTVMAPKLNQEGWKKIIKSLDSPSGGPSIVKELVRLENAEPAPIQRAIRVLAQQEANRPKLMNANDGFQNAVFQQDAAANPDLPADKPAPDGGPAGSDQGGSGVIGDTQIQFVPELGTIIIRGAKRDVERVMEVIREIEKQSEITRPEIEVVPLMHADSNAVATLLKQLYIDVLSARQGEVSITALDSPNSLLLIGRAEAINGVRDLIAKIDQPIDESSRLRIFRLQHASASDAEVTIRNFFVDRPGAGDDIRPGIGIRVRVLADYRTNSLIVSGSPRDMVEVTKLINDLDVQQITAQSEIKIFPLNNAVAEDLAEVLQSAISGTPEENENVTTPSTTLSIVAVDPSGEKLLDSGILTGAVITADTGANSIVVRAPSASMPLIAELIRQLDKAPGAESLVKVFTIENGDATRLTTALQDLFGDEAATSGTSVGAGNLGGLPASTSATSSTLIPLRFSTETRTNSIIASGSAEDLEVVESILLRLDSKGFSERITEVIWLRHQTAANIATAIQEYVQQRSQSVSRIQQLQQGGLSATDLPDRDLIVVAEEISNSLLLSVSPRLYEDVRRLIDKLDRRPPMVLIKVLLAEVSLGDLFEIGGEVGLQDSLMFDRGVAVGALPGAGPQSVPGFGFNSNGTPNVNSYGQESLAGRGVTSFGVGTTNGNLNYGGFVLSAASESVSLLLRTLQDASRLQILSRPQIMTMDNTEGLVQVGRTIAQVTGVVSNGVSGNQVVTTPLDVGLIMRVRPRVGSDGLIIMDVDAERSSRDTSAGTPVPTGTGGVVVINDILKTTAQSTVAAYSGQTVIFGGLIQKQRSVFSRRVPYLADIPILGYFFKYDQESENRSELLVILTPMLVTGEEDLDYVKATESSRMSWCLADVVEMHGDVGLSGGYGLWGPANGGTIYPDLQPTVDQFYQENCLPTDGSVLEMNDGSTPPILDSGNETVVPGSVIYSDPIMIESGQSVEQNIEQEIGQPLSRRSGSTESRTVPVQTYQRPTVITGGNVSTSSPMDSTRMAPSRNPTPAAPKPIVSEPAINPYSRMSSEQATVAPTQASWIEVAQSKPKADFIPGDTSRPQRLGGFEPSNSAQPIPSISPQSWIR